MKARKFFEMHRVWVILGAVMALVLIVGMAILIPLSLRGGTPSTTPTPSPTGTGTTVITPTPGEQTPMPEPGVVLGPQACPPGVASTTYWNEFLKLPGTDRSVESVSCANILGNPTLQALVTVRHRLPGSALDVYVFDKITSGQPTRLFLLSGLLKGDAKISYYNTILTAEVDRNSVLNAGKSSAQWTPDLFREFKWVQGAPEQVAFPGIYPDLTRYQAEQDQALVNKGQDTWKNDPAQVAQKLTAQFFQWKRQLTATVLSGGGANDVYATVKVSEPPPTGGSSAAASVIVTLSRLEGNTHNMWVAIGVADGSSTLTSVDARSLVSSPVKLEGKGSAFENTIGMAYILDHQYNKVGSAIVTGVPGVGMGMTTYSIQVSYETSFKGGPQEGVVEVQFTSPIQSEPYSAALVKVLLNPEPGVALGPVSCPASLDKPAYWASVIGLDTSKYSVGTLNCANMKGDATLQIVVPVYHTDGSQLSDVYVYDQITAAHPSQIFKLQGLYRGGAMISGYSTLMTSQVDQNSSINKGKTGDQLTTDLFREFRWSDGAGILVQTTFPGFYPDLTRWQAEQDQNAVKAGQDAWKNNAVQVAQRMAAQLLKWPANTRATLVSGGGSQDVDAVVQVTSSNPGGMAINVTLSRLEGNASNIWEVISAQSSTGLLTISLPRQGELLRSPVTVTGTGSAFEGVVGRAFVIDHLYATIGQAQVTGAGNGKTTFSTPVTYTSSFQGGAQEGLVAVYMYSQADGSIATAAIVKVMIGA